RQRDRTQHRPGPDPGARRRSRRQQPKPWTGGDVHRAAPGCFVLTSPVTHHPRTNLQRILTAILVESSCPPVRLVHTPAQTALIWSYLMKKMLASIALVATVGLTLTACGGDESASGDASGESASGETTGQATDFNDVDVSFAAQM